jgi:rhodanese-related sulfurtransferase
MKGFLLILHLKVKIMRTFVYTVIIISTLFFSASSQSSDSLKYRSLEPYDFHLQYLKTDSSMLIDVREPFECRSSRIHGSINIPSSGNIERAADTLNKDLTYFLYCKTDYRSRRVAEMLYDKGFRKLVILEGGIVAWKKDGMKVDKGRVKKHKQRTDFSQ